MSSRSSWHSLHNRYNLSRGFFLFFSLRNLTAWANFTTTKHKNGVIFQSDVAHINWVVVSTAPCREAVGARRWWGAAKPFTSSIRTAPASKPTNLGSVAPAQTDAAAPLTEPKPRWWSSSVLMGKLHGGPSWWSRRAPATATALETMLRGRPQSWVTLACEYRSGSTQKFISEITIITRVWLMTLF